MSISNGEKMFTMFYILKDKILIFFETTKDIIIHFENLMIKCCISREITFKLISDLLKAGS